MKSFSNNSTFFKQGQTFYGFVLFCLNLQKMSASGIWLSAVSNILKGLVLCRGTLIFSALYRALQPIWRFGGAENKWRGN
ncbi:MAG: hypothetical protein DBY25_07270 [Clostridiales bacterium]|nr:MAG: hypothetical protein DBY25_07270 [Clostridiales bacterium]